MRFTAHVTFIDSPETQQKAKDLQDQTLPKEKANNFQKPISTTPTGGVDDKVNNS